MRTRPLSAQPMLPAGLAILSAVFLAACWMRESAAPPSAEPSPPPVAATAPSSATPAVVSTSTVVAAPWRPAHPPQVTSGTQPPLTTDWVFAVQNQGDGPKIVYDGGIISTGSPFFCVTPDWKTAHFYMVRYPVKIDYQPGRTAITSDPASPTAFTLDTMLLEATGPQAMRITVDGQLTADVPAMIEYIPLCIPASVLHGAEIETELGDRLVVGDAHVELPNPARNLRLRTRTGSIVLSVAEGDGLVIYDRRTNPYHGRQVFLFMAGRMSEHTMLAKGERYRHVVDLTLPDGFQVRPELPTVEPAATAIALPAALAEVPTPSPALCPQPRSIAFSEGRIALPAEIVISDDGVGEGNQIVNLFADALAVNGVAHPVRTGAKGWLRLRKIEAPAPEQWDYHRLTISKQGVEVAAVSPAAASYALGTLAQLIENRSVRHGVIEDWSDFRYRGLHVIACDVDALKVQSSVIRRIMVPLRYNQILLECKYVRWPSQPEIHHPQGMPYEDFTALIAFAEQRFITAIPCINTYGHSEYLFYNQANLDIAEDPTSPFAYDVSNPRTWEVISALLSDVRNAAPKAPWIHIGHDEVVMRGRYPHRPANLKKSLAELLSQDLAFYKAWAARNGTALMVWNDYLSGRSHPKAQAELQSVISTLDRSTVVAMWDYDPASDYSGCDPFLSRGVTVFGATGEEEVSNVTTFARYGKAKRLPGMMHTTWTGYFGSIQAIYRWPRKLWPYIQAGVSFWNAEAPVIDRQTPSRATAMYDRMVGDLFPEVRRIAPGDRVQPVDLGTVANRSLAEPGGFASGPLRTTQGGYFVLPGNANGAAGVVISNGGSLRIPIGRPARALSILWAGLALDPSVQEVGSLTIAGAQPTPIIVRRHLGNLLHALVDIGDGEIGKLLTRTSAEENFSLARPVFSSAGRSVLWQYDLALDGTPIEALTITAGKTHELVIVGVSIVE